MSDDMMLIIVCSTPVGGRSTVEFSVGSAPSTKHVHGAEKTVKRESLIAHAYRVCVYYTGLTYFSADQSLPVRS